MKMPTKIKVGCFDYTIAEYDHKLAAAESYYGKVVHLTREIFVDTTHSPIQTVETLIHEVMHCVYTVYNIKDSDDEERTIEAMAAGLTQIYRDNPDLLKFIQQNIHAQNKGQE